VFKILENSLSRLLGVIIVDLILGIFLYIYLYLILFIQIRFNIAEAVNFALKRWIELGVKANSCRCRGDSVRIDMEKFINNVNEHKRKKKIAGRNSILNDSNRMVTVKCTKCGQWRKVSRGINRNLILSNSR